LYWVHDAPLLSWLGVKPGEGRFRPVFMSGRDMHQALERVLKEEGALKRNRNGVIPIHPEFRSTKSLSPVLWSLINEVPAQSSPKAPPAYLCRPGPGGGGGGCFHARRRRARKRRGPSKRRGGPLGTRHGLHDALLALACPQKRRGYTRPHFPVQDAGLVAWQRLYKIEFAP